MTPSRKLLVEGRDDQHVIYALLKCRDFPQVFEVEEKGGIDKLLTTFPVQAKGSNIETLGIVIDADVDVGARWQSIRSSLNDLGYENCPINIPADGLVLENDDLPRIGVWIMPDNSLPGMLEDFIGYLVPKTDKLWPYVNDTLTNMPNEIRSFKSIHLSKARIHTWLAWQSDPGSPLGQAITKKYLDADAPTAVPFLDWLHRLFVEGL